MKKVRLSNSRVDCYHHCHKKYFWTYIEGYYPVGPPSNPLQIGGILHELKDRWIAKKMPEKLTADWLVDLINGEYPGNPIDTTREVGFTALGLFNAFLMKEEQMPLQYVSSETIMELECKDYILYTRVDGLARTQDGRLWREETKTTSKMDSAYLSGLKGGLQAGIAYKVMKGTLPEKVAGTIYTILVKTKVPQCERTMIGAEKFLLKMTEDCLKGAIDGIKAERWDPSMKCYPYNRECEYRILCKGATPGIIKNFYARKEDDGIIECGPSEG